MKARSISTIVFAVALTAVPIASLGDSCGDHGAKEAKAAAVEAAAAGDIVSVAVRAGDFKTLVAAVNAAGLAETLQGTGPFTVFAPSDAAFAKLPAGALEALLADKEKLIAVLSYHVVPGKLQASDVVAAKEAKTVQGQSLTISTVGGVRVDEANVVKTDIFASNGVIHVIDAVVLPN